jgi:hypothetical protein
VAPERGFDDRGPVTLVYTMPDGERALRRGLSAAAPGRVDVTAARTVPPADLASTDSDGGDRYAAEARRMRERHAPGEPVRGAPVGPGPGRERC